MIICTGSQLLAILQATQAKPVSIALGLLELFYKLPRAIKIVQLNFILAFPPAPKRENFHINDHAAMSSTCNPFTNGGRDVAKRIWAGSFFA